ncbi:hypothetical protein SAMD00024442_24_5 [Candidatus Symbiothrix dinenymphae]|nr:hypothetical protein SAMD00024442_24_5 [Candidatus Symbiothrix dinenymphae]
MKKRSIWIGITLVLVLIVVNAVYLIMQLRVEREKQNKDNEELLGLATEALTDQFNDLDAQYDGFKITLRNDSLIAQLEAEQQKVRKLQAELKNTKAADAKKISALKKELETLRAIMKHYVAQIDSLDRLNKHLMQENEAISGRYREATQTVTQLSTEKEQLTERVQIASKLDASNVSVRGLDKKDKPTQAIKKMMKIEVSFTINKNITAKSGTKDIYIRIQKPDEDILVKEPSNVFFFESKNISYSAKRTIEYKGEEMPLSIYWEVEEMLLPGSYRADIFADGNLIGRKSFQLEK